MDQDPWKYSGLQIRPCGTSAQRGLFVLSVTPSELQPGDVRGGCFSLNIFGQPSNTLEPESQ